jgi:hypothetical protein
MRTGVTLSRQGHALRLVPVVFDAARWIVAGPAKNVAWETSDEELGGFLLADADSPLVVHSQEHLVGVGASMRQQPPALQQPAIAPFSDDSHLVLLPGYTNGSL